MFSRYFKAKNTDTKHSLFNEYKSLRNELTAKTRNGIIQYYRNYFENDNKKISAIWKGIWSLVKIKPSNKTDITILDSKCETITDQKKIVNAFNHLRLGTPLSRGGGGGGVEKPERHSALQPTTESHSTIFLLILDLM